jgi:geranyl-CoA carboxylase alpha subunit
MHYRPFKSVLVANRGEIARRILEVAHDNWIRTIAVYSEADATSSHLGFADDTVSIGPAEARLSYLNPDAILQAAIASRAEAIHPGYGFLSENAEFAQAVLDAGIVWIGPSPESIRSMGDKANAKRIAWKAGVPLIPGYDGEDQNDAKLQSEADRIGYPVMIKAVAGGGGRGMRKVKSAEDFPAALQSARREALSSFGSEKVILERAMENVRHVEIQVFGDSAGNIVHLGDRDCSLQRRNQKVIEEAPSPIMTPALRVQMGEAAVRLAKAVHYVNAGTAEFLVDNDGKFYFLEMNTRIQVEHPVTERIVHFDLIQLQLDIAAGKPLPFQQDNIEFDGHAIELRLCAEDPDDNFKPQSGKIVSFFESGGRTDSGFEHGSTVPQEYDSMLAKLIAHAPTREEARLKAIRMAKETIVLGVKTNKSYLVELLSGRNFADGKADTAYAETISRSIVSPLETELAKMAALYLAHAAGKAWRSTGSASSIINLGHQNRKVSFQIKDGRIDDLQFVKAEYVPDRHHTALTLRRGNLNVLAVIALIDNKVHIDDYDGHDAIFEDITYAPAERKDAAGAGAIRAPMAGKIIKIAAEAGTTVAKGDLLVILEAMKMEHELRAATDGIIDNIAIKPGDQVAMRQLLVTVKPV